MEEIFALVVGSGGVACCHVSSHNEQSSWSIPEGIGLVLRESVNGSESTILRVVSVHDVAGNPILDPFR